MTTDTLSRRDRLGRGPLLPPARALTWAAVALAALAAWLLWRRHEAMAWLWLSLDAGRPHRIEPAQAWHARAMVLAWAVMIPLGVLAARFFKITPRQPWPAVLDNKWWWRAHLILQLGGIALTMVAVALVWRDAGAAGGWARAHRLLAWLVCALAAVQAFGGMLRGSKGGGTPGERGDHYDMTPRRFLFERVHKACGYLAMAVALAAIATGLISVNAPRWMAVFIALWTLAWLAAFAWLQRRGWCIDTYQAIWGPDPRHPGNRMPVVGPGVRRIGAAAPNG